MGLADGNVYILDPAVGTGTFLYFVIQQIYERLKAIGLAGGWSDYVRKHLLPRVFGFELMNVECTPMFGHNRLERFDGSAPHSV